MNNKVLAILDREEGYAYGLMEFFEERENLPFRLHVFTSQDRFNAFGMKEEIECLLVSENIYNRCLEEYHIPHIIVLSETGSIVNNTLHHINKYQSCDGIYREVLQYYADHSQDATSLVRKSTKNLKVIGIYTPIGRCLQTKFSVTLGQLLSRKAKTLYMNFERYSGLSLVLERDFNSDISDLMYYFECAKEKLSYRIDSIVENVGGLDFIPPANIYQNLAGIRGEQWVDLFMEMEKCTEYEYLILDLTDGVPDLWHILRFCDKVYTISRGDTLAMAKIDQYEKTIKDTEYSEVLTKTKKCALPMFQNLPHKFDELSQSELARFIREFILPEMV